MICGFLSHLCIGLQEPLWLQNSCGQMELHFSRCVKKPSSYLGKLICTFSVLSIPHWPRKLKECLTGLLIKKLNLVNFCAISFTYKFLLWKFFWFAFSIFCIVSCSWHVPWTYAYDCFWDCIDDQSSSIFNKQVKIPNEL